MHGLDVLLYICKGRRAQAEEVAVLLNAGFDRAEKLGMLFEHMYPSGEQGSFIGIAGGLGSGYLRIVDQMENQLFSGLIGGTPQIRDCRRRCAVWHVVRQDREVVDRDFEVRQQLQDRDAIAY
jgi:hypothetical protein